MKTEHGMKASDEMRFGFLMENRTDKAGLTAEHGLSIYIEACGKKMLFDAGATELMVRNAERMGVDLAAVDLAVVSHGHYDHTGGFPAFCRLNSRAPVYVHRNAFRESYELKEGQLCGPDDGIRWTDEEREAMKDRLILTDGPLWVSEDICVTGTVQSEEGFEPTEVFYYRDEDGKITADDMSHEQCLVLRQPEGLYVFSGCSHTGVIGALNTAKELFPGEKVAVLAAGMHLYKASDTERSRVVEAVAAEAPERVIPVHCTGMDAICYLKDLLKDRCVTAGAGDWFGRYGEKCEMGERCE